MAIIDFTMPPPYGKRKRGKGSVIYEHGQSGNSNFPDPQIPARPPGELNQALWPDSVLFGSPERFQEIMGYPPADLQRPKPEQPPRRLGPTLLGNDEPEQTATGRAYHFLEKALNAGAPQAARAAELGSTTGTTAGQNAAVSAQMDEFLFKGDKSFKPNVRYNPLNDNEEYWNAKSRTILGEPRRDNAPLSGFGDKEARAMIKENMSPGELHRANGALFHHGYTGDRLIALDAPPHARGNIYRILNDSGSFNKISTGRDSPFGNIIAQAEGKEGEKEGLGIITMGWKNSTNHDGGTYSQKVYYPHNDGKGNRTIGFGIKMYDDADIATLAAGGAAPLTADQVRNGQITYLSAPQVRALYQSRIAEAKTRLRKAMPFVDFLSPYRQAVPLSMTYNMGKGSPTSGHGIESFRKFIEYSAAGDFYNAALEMIRSDRSEDVKGRCLWEALLYLTDGDSSLTGDERLDDYKDKVAAALNSKENEGKSTVQVMEEMFINEAARLGYGPKTERSA